MPQCENGKVGIPFADHTTAGELAARYSTVSLNSDVVPGSESITGAIYGGQQQFAALAVSCYPSDWLRSYCSSNLWLRFISNIWT